MIAWLALPALAGEPSTLQRISELEWARSAPLPLVSQVPGGDVESRASAVRALGRLRSAEALDALVDLRHDPDLRVQIEVARALGTTPGTAETLRAWLAEVPAPASPAERADAEDGLLVALLGALGHQGGARDVGVLLQALREPWPVGAAAARALGVLGTRKVAALDAAVPPLVQRLDAVDPRLVGDAAWALSRIGLQPATSAERAVVARRILGGASETARAWLVKAAWPVLDPAARDELFVTLASDRSRLVRVALLGALTPPDATADVLATWLADPDPWIRSAAIAALGREGSDVAIEALEQHAASARSPWERAEAMALLASPGPAGADDPAPVRAARVAATEDRAALVGLAKDDPEAAVRSAAAGALLDDEGTPASVGEALLGATDPAIREAGVELLGRAGPAVRAKALLVHLRVETADDVLAAGLADLVEAVAEDPKAIGAKDPALPALLERNAVSADPRVRKALADLAAATGRPAPPAPPAPAGEREIVMPDGQVVKVAAGRPVLEEVGRVRGAVVETSRGTFRMALDPDTAPLAVANFAALAEAGFFDGLVVHRVVPGFVVQTGCPRGDGWGGPGYVLPDETSELPFGEGALGMARGSLRDSGGSQWFVTTSPQPHLVGEYTRFGEVTYGLEVVKRLAIGDTIESVTIERVP